MYTQQKPILNKGARPAVAWEIFQWPRLYLEYRGGAGFTNSQGHEAAQHLKSSVWLILDRLQREVKTLRLKEARGQVLRAPGHTLFSVCVFRRFWFFKLKRCSRHTNSKGSSSAWYEVSLPTAPTHPMPSCTLLGVLSRPPSIRLPGGFVQQR